MSWHPRTIGESIAEELRRFGRPGDVADIVAAWPEAVGEAIAVNAWPARIARDGTLHVTTSSSVWAFELTKLEETVRGRLSDRLGKKAPAKLRFRAGRLPAPAALVPKEVESVPKPSPATFAAAAEIAAPIADEELRELVLRAAAASLARAAETAPDGAAAPPGAPPDDRPLW